MYQAEKENKPKDYNNYNEIDLSVIVHQISKLFKSVGHKIRYTSKAIYNNLSVVILISLLGLGISYGIHAFIQPYYTSSMTLVLSEIRNQFVENQLNRLSVMIEEDNYEAVAEDLEIGLASAKQIKEMSFSNLDQDRVAEDSVLTGSPFEIELTLYDNTLFSSLEPALANYLENNRYFSKQKIIKQREMESIINKLREDIVAMDSVKKTAIAPQGPVNGFVYGQPLDPSNLFRESIKMYEQQVELEGELEQLDNIQIVNGFAPRLKPTGPELLSHLAIGGVVSFLVSVIVALTLEKKRRKVVAY